MDWKFWKRQTTAAERSLHRLRSDAAAGDGRSESVDFADLQVTVLAGPASTAPGTPISVYNEGEPLVPGAPVQVIGTFVTQFGRVVAVADEKGAPADVLRDDEEGTVVLDSQIDLADVFRGTMLIGPQVDAGASDSLTLFQLGVHRAEARGSHALVFGRLLSGLPRAGVRAQGTVGPHEEPWRAEVIEVQTIDAEVCLLLRDLPADRFLRGDIVFALA